MHDFGRLLRDIETDLVEQLHRPHREPEFPHRFVDRHNPLTLVQQPTCFIHVRRQNAVHPEPRVIAHDDHRLAHGAAEGHGCDGHPGSRLVGLNDLEQRHLFDRREEMHPDDPLRSPQHLSDP